MGTAGLTLLDAKNFDRVNGALVAGLSRTFAVLVAIAANDASPDAPLEAGAVVTVEPGIYIAAERIGIRIEDDVEVTPSGPRILTPGIPRTADEVERAMAAR